MILVSTRLRAPEHASMAKEPIAACSAALKSKEMAESHSKGPMTELVGIDRV